MYSKIVWCYIFVLTLLDISRNTKLTAQGKSHGVTLHDSLVGGINFQEWGKDGGEGGDEDEGGGGEGAVRLWPRALALGRRALGAAHAATVTLHNAANTTLHLASVAGTTPDFHASFFDAKTLAPDGNTTFSVVFVARREGPVRAHLYIHTSLGVHKYPVSAEGVASEWDVWPLVGVRVPLNATLEPVLTVRNPTAHAVQVHEVYSSGAWLGLQLPDGADSAHRDMWTIPPHATRALVRLRITPPAHLQHHHHPAHHPLTAYVRIKVNATGLPGAAGGLLVVVEARAVPAGEHALPLQLRLRARGTHDPPDTFDIKLGSSVESEVSVEGGVWGARCAAHPPAEPWAEPPPPHHAAANGASGNGGAGGMEHAGARLAVLRERLAPRAPPLPAAALTLDYGALWAGYGGGGGAAGAYCWGWAVLGRASVPYSVRLLPGTLTFTPQRLEWVTGGAGAAGGEREVRVRNTFAAPVQLLQLVPAPDLHTYFHVWGVEGGAVCGGGGGEAVVARVRLRSHVLAHHPDLNLATNMTLRTNVSDYVLQLYVYTGALSLEWEWPNSGDGWLRVGGVGTSSTRRVGARLVNPAPVPLCVTELSAHLPGAHVALQPCAHAAHAPPTTQQHPCRCVSGGGWSQAWLTVVAPAREGELSGAVRLATQHAATLYNVTLQAHAGRLHALPLHLPDAAPWAGSARELVLESSMALRMRVLHVVPAHKPDPALHYQEEEGVVEAGRRAVGVVRYQPERQCGPARACYTGIDPAAPDGAAWWSRTAGGALGEAEWRAEAELVRARAALYSAAAPHARNISLLVHTDRVVHIPAAGSVRLRWPRLAARAGWAGLAGVGGAAHLPLTVRNPSRSHALLLHAALGPPPHHLALPPLAYVECAWCAGEECVHAPAAFSLVSWRATRGQASPAGVGGAGGGVPALLLAPDAEVELAVKFAPAEPRTLAAYIYLRNNLTVVEAVQLAGRGAFPSFELGGRAPGAREPLLLEVSECGEPGGATLRRTLIARNTGLVPVRLRDWRVAGTPCAARGFRLQPCAPLALAPNESRALSLAFTADWTLARVAATLHLRTDTAPAAFLLHAAAPARLLPACAARAPRPPWEPALRAAGTLLALAALALVLAAAGFDAERILRRVRAARAPAPPRAPLDLRAVAAPPAPPRPPPAHAAAPAHYPPLARRRRPRRVDPHAESRAFERWRASLRRTDEDDDRSSEDADDAPALAPQHPAHAPDAPLLHCDDFEPIETDPPARYEPEGGDERARSSADDDAASTGSDSSSPPEHDDADAEHTTSADSAEGQRESPARADRRRPAHHPPASDACALPGEGAGRAVRARRDPADTPRRGERRAPDADPAAQRRAAAKSHARKDKVAKRRAPLTPPRSSPAAGGAAGGCGEARGPGAPPGGGAVRVGATWSSVVARSGVAPAALAPIGSDVRRRAEPAPRPAAADNSLFYFNGDQGGAGVGVGARPEAEFAWRPSPPADRPAYVPPLRDYLGDTLPARPEDEVGVGAHTTFGSIGPVWGSSLAARAPGAAWPWAAYTPPPGPVRPPPGFPAVPPPGAAPPAPAPVVGGGGGAAPRPVRAFDPFHSLASIWTRTALDWRADDDPPRDQ